VCHHLVRGTVLPDATVADELHRQSERFLVLGRPGAAATALQDAARLTPDPSVRRARAMAAVRHRVETDMEGISSRDLLDLVGPGPLPAGGEGWLRWLQVLAQPDLPTQLEAALAAVEGARNASDPGLLRALLWSAAETAWEMGRADHGLALACEYAALDGRGVPSDRDEPAWTGDALMAAGFTQVGRLAEACALRLRVLAQADSLDPVTCPLPLLLDAVGLDATLLADTPGSDARIARAVTRAEAAGYEPVACLWGIRAWRERGRGAWQAALRWRDEGLAVSVETRAPATVCGLLALSVELCALQGDERRLHDDADALRRLAGGYGDVRRLLTLERALGMDALARGELAGAVAHLQEAADVSFLGRGLRDPVLSSRVDLVEALMRLGDADAARERAGATVVLLEQMDQPLASAWAGRVRALTADDDEQSDAWFDCALAAHARSSDPFEHGRTELLVGEHLRRARRRADARRHLAHAQALFARLGARPWEHRAAQELRAAGGGVQSTARGFADLTPQELSVALAVAGGRSTREVADLLVLSPRTVESHLGRVYRKLGISGRSALASTMAGTSATTVPCPDAVE
jgi:DNA-binding CsgD family transcriptional regulator